MRTTAIVFAATLLAATPAVAQPPLPVLQYDAPPNFYKSAMTNPDDFSSNEVNASVQVYPFRPFAGNIQQLVGQTLLRDWIDPRYREENVAGQPEVRSVMVPGAQAAFLVSFFENRVGLPRPHVRLVAVAGNAAAILDLSANSPVTLQRVSPAMDAMIKSVRVVAGVAAPSMTHGSTAASRAQAGIYMGYKQKFQVNLWGGVGSGTFTPAPHFYLFSPDGRVYRTFDILKVPQTGVSAFDFATASRTDPENSGQFVLQGNQLVMQFGGANPETVRAPVSAAGSFTLYSVTYARQ
jgi:hypothetical protein